jgi:hypothetical protein
MGLCSWRPHVQPRSRTCRCCVARALGQMLLHQTSPRCSASWHMGSACCRVLALPLLHYLARLHSHVLWHRVKQGLPLLPPPAIQTPPSLLWATCRMSQPVALA